MLESSEPELDPARRMSDVSRFDLKDELSSSLEDIGELREQTPGGFIGLSMLSLLEDAGGVMSAKISGLPMLLKLSLLLALKQAGILLADKQMSGLSMNGLSMLPGL